MKKAIILLLALVLCLSLCACGKSKAVKGVETLIDSIGEVSADSETAVNSAVSAYEALSEEEKKTVANYGVLKVAKEELLFLKADALFEAGQYDEAIELLCLIESYAKVSNQIIHIENTKQEQERLALEAEYAARPRKEVQINIENLETYFEFICIPYFNTFGQLDQIVCKIFPRDEYINRIDFGAEFLIEIGYKADGITATVEYDENSNTFTYGDPLPGWGGWCGMDEILSVSSEDLSKIASYKLSDIDNPEIQGLGNLWTDTIYHENGMNGCNEWSYVIEQVQGTIVLFAE